MKRAISTIIAVAIVLYLGVGSISCALTATLNHDEHQFMASAYMVARAGMQPYRDFAYFQMPNLVYVYAVFFHTARPFLAARLFNGACGFALCLSIFLTARFLFRNRGRLTATLLAAAAAVLLASTVSFQHTTSRVWNHSSATLCAVLAFFLHEKARRERSGAYSLFCGFALGMALGIRLTFAPLLAPFLLSIFAFTDLSWRDKARRLLAFSAGALLANAPALYFCLTSCADFMFGMLGYRRLDPQYLNSLPDPPGSMDLSGKLLSLFQYFQLDNGGLVVAAIAALGVIVLAIKTVKGSATPRYEAKFLLALLPFLLAGYLAPTPTQFQYSFALLPFLLLLGLYAFASLKIDNWSKSINRVVAIVAVALLAGISLFDAARFGKGVVKLRQIFQPEDWVPVEVESTARWVREQIGANPRGKVLTLSPIYVIEAGLPIYKEFVTGPFAWRVSYLVSADEAAARKMPWSPGLREFLQRDPPAAVVTGLELKPKLEVAIISEMTSLGYDPTTAPDGGVVWLPRQ